jgi:hypothetical protein
MFGMMRVEAYQSCVWMNRLEFVAMPWREAALGPVVAGRTHRRFGPIRMSTANTSLLPKAQLRRGLSPRIRICFAEACWRGGFCWFSSIWSIVTDVRVIAGSIGDKARVAGTGRVLKFLAEEVSTDTELNRMGEYQPCYRAANYPELDRPLTSWKLCEAAALARRYGLARLDHRSLGQ